MTALKLTQIGNSVGLCLPEETLALGLFLAINGYRLQATQADATLTMLSVAAGDSDEAAFAEWIRGHIQPRSRGSACVCGRLRGTSPNNS